MLPAENPVSVAEQTVDPRRRKPSRRWSVRGGQHPTSDSKMSASQPRSTAKRAKSCKLFAAEGHEAPQEIRLRERTTKWAMLGSNQRPPPCKGGATSPVFLLPLRVRPSG